MRAIIREICARAQAISSRMCTAARRASGTQGNRQAGRLRRRAIFCESLGQITRRILTAATLPCCLMLSTISPRPQSLAACCCSLLLLLLAAVSQYRARLACDADVDGGRSLIYIYDEESYDGELSACIEQHHATSFARTAQDIFHITPSSRLQPWQCHSCRHGGTGAAVASGHSASPSHAIGVLSVAGGLVSVGKSQR